MSGDSVLDHATRPFFVEVGTVAVFVRRVASRGLGRDRFAERELFLLKLRIALLDDKVHLVLVAQLFKLLSRQLKEVLR